MYPISGIPKVTQAPVVPNLTSTAASPGGNGMTLYLDSVPYPVVTGSNDPETVAMLMEDYAGAASELTAITQYIFQNTVSDNEPYANAMLQTAIVEMTHLDMLSDAIKTLGGNPRFGNGQYYWQASAVNYADTMKEMLEANIQGETTAIQNYQKHAAATKNETVRALLLRIIEDEKLHLRFFKETLNTL